MHSIRTALMISVIPDNVDSQKIHCCSKTVVVFRIELMNVEHWHGLDYVVNCFDLFQERFQLPQR